MSRQKRPGPLRRPDDSPAMTAAIDWFHEHRLPVARVSPLQLKFRDLSYYPHSGSMNRDQQRRMEGTGLPALERVVCQMLGVERLPNRSAGG